MNNCEKLQLILKIASIKKIQLTNCTVYMYICLLLRKKERKKERKNVNLSFSRYTTGFFATEASPRDEIERPTRSFVS